MSNDSTACNVPFPYGWYGVEPPFYMEPVRPYYYDPVRYYTMPTANALTAAPTLTESDVESIARRVVELMKETP